MSVGLASDLEGTVAGVVRRSIRDAKLYPPGNRGADADIVRSADGEAGLLTSRLQVKIARKGAQDGVTRLCRGGEGTGSGDVGKGGQTATGCQRNAWIRGVFNS